MHSCQVIGTSTQFMTVSDTLSRKGIYLPKRILFIRSTLCRHDQGWRQKKSENYNHQDKQNTFTDNVVLPKNSVLIMNLHYDRWSQHTAMIGPLHHEINGLCWCVKLQITMIYIFPSLRFFYLCMQPLQVHVHVVVHQSMHSLALY